MNIARTIAADEEPALPWQPWRQWVSIMVLAGLGGLIALLWMNGLSRVTPEAAVQHVAFRILDDASAGSSPGLRPEAGTGSQVGTGGGAQVQATASVTHATPGPGMHWLHVADVAALHAAAPGHLLVLRGRGFGVAELTAYDAEGKLLWRAKPEESAVSRPSLMRSNLGIALTHADLAAPVDALVWRVETIGGETIAMQTLGVAPMQAEIGRNDRRLGLLAAVVGLLVGACLAIAWLARSRLPAYLAACLLTAALVCANAGGWDVYGLRSWLSLPVIAAWRSGAHALHLAAICALFLPLFREELTHPRFRQGLRLAPMAALLLAVAAPLLPPNLFLVIFVYCACVAAIALLAATIDILRSARSLRALLFLVALLAQIAGTAGLLLSGVGTGPWANVIGVAGTVLFAVAGTCAVVRAMWSEHRHRERARRNAAQSMRKYRHVYYSVPVALISVDTLGQVLRWNDRAAQLFGNELRHGRMNTLAGVLGAERAAALLAGARNSGHYQCELTVPAGEGPADGDTPGERIHAVDALLSDKAIEISLADVTERSRLAATLEHMAYHDVLGDCLNRRGIERAIEHFAATATAATPAALICVDLDRFKAINDVFGHAVGDAVVVELAVRLLRGLPDSAQLGRLGGGEFIALLPGCDLPTGRAVGERLLAAIAGDGFKVEGSSVSVEASIGVVEFVAGIPTRELIAYADAACAQAKQRGGGGLMVASASSEHLQRYRAEVSLGARLRSSLPVDRLCVYAEPIVALRGEGAPCYEVLLRERDEQGRIGSPARLIGAAQRHGVMSALDRFMLEKTLRHLSEHPEHSRRMGFITVNLSGVSLNDERFLADANSLLTEHRGVAAKVCLEITETVALYDVRNTRRFIDRMRTLGVQIALDDFGAGYSSFAYLKDLPASLIKIDGQFIIDIARQPRNQVIVRTIRGLAQELGMSCLAEWVQDVASLRVLLDMQLDYAQGYVFSHALPIEAWLQTKVDLSPLQQAREVVNVA
ncbi:MAG: GGDEF domain-containing protein [Burkholderiales bacterium]|nr:GGDEF domain-containing protein [Burkholderiales bacterium]